MLYAQYGGITTLIMITDSFTVISGYVFNGYVFILV